MNLYPRSLFIEDLILEIQRWKHNLDDIIVITLDVHKNIKPSTNNNKEPKSVQQNKIPSNVRKLMNTIGLMDAISTIHGKCHIETFNGSKNRLDYSLKIPNGIPFIKYAGCTDDDKLCASDNRGILNDLKKLNPGAATTTT